MIIEVLSPSTELWDRSGKFANYRRLETLQEYGLVSQDKILVERFTRHGDEWVLKEWNRLEDVLRLASIGCDLTLRQIYEKVSIEPESSPPHEDGARGG